MRKIILTSLFFCLAITTVLAQVATVNIETPSSNGLSNNQVDDFDVHTDGTILNNSASAGTAQLGNTAVTGNSNITAGSEASLILFQVTGNSGSDLEGTIEVFGTEAGLIIANPNGIDCDGCGFINTNRVDLVTGTANFSGDDLTNFSIDGSSTLTVSGSGFLSDAVADELNLVSRDLRIQAQAKANNTLRSLAGNDTYDHTTNIITSDNSEASVHSISISASGSLEANYIEIVSTELSSGGIYGVVNYGRDISADSLKLDSNGLFRNQNEGTNVGNINISNLLEVINTKRFINNSNITVDILSITTDEFFNNHNGGTHPGNIVVTDTFSLSTPNASYTNTGTVSSDSLNLTIGGDFANNTTTLNNFTFNNLAITTEGYYTQGVSIDIAGNLRIQVSGEATLDDNASIQAKNLFFSAYSFYNQADLTITYNATFDIGNDFLNGFKLDGTGYDGGNISADNFTVTAGSRFFNRDNATITANNFNVTAVNFYNWDSATINADNFNVTAGDDFYNRSTINANDFNVTANGFRNWDSATINADSFNVTARGFSNVSSTISANNFNVTAVNFYNFGRATINADNFNVTAGDEFSNLIFATINANDFNVVAGGLFANHTNATISANDVSISANSFFNSHPTREDGNINADTLTLSVAGDFDYATDYLGNLLEILMLPIKILLSEMVILPIILALH